MYATGTCEYNLINIAQIKKYGYKKLFLWNALERLDEGKMLKELPLNEELPFVIKTTETVWENPVSFWMDFPENVSIISKSLFYLKARDIIDDGLSV